MAITKRYAHINHAQGDAQNKLDAELAYITGSLYVGQDATLAAKLMVTGEITGSSNLYLNGAAHMVGAVQMDSTLAVTDKASFGDTTALEAILTAGFGGGPVVVDIAVEGIVAVGGILAVMDDAHVMGSGSIGGDLSVDKELAVHGTSTLKDTVPEEANHFDLGKSNNKWRGIYVQSGSFEHLEAQYLDVSVTASVAQLTGSAGAKFTAGDLKVEAGQVSASGDFNAGGELHLAGLADINGALDVALMSDLRGAVVAHSTFNAKGNADLDSALNVDGVSDFGGVVTAHDDVNVSGSLEVHLTANVAGNFSVASNKFTVAATSGDTAVAGDLIVSGDLTVMGDRIEAQITELRIEDGLITLMSGSTSRLISDHAGIEVEVGSGSIKPTISFENSEDAWQSNLDWIPSIDLTYDLGQPAKRWNELNLGGAANIDGAVNAGSLDVDAAATFGASIAVTGTGSFSGAVTASTLSASAGVSGGTLTIAGAADLNGGLDVVGAVSASQGVTAASFDADGQAHVGSLLVDGAAAISGGLGVVGAVSASAAFSGASLDVDGAVDVGGALNVVGNATLTSLTASVGAKIEGPLSASSMVVEGQATFNGTATFNGDFVVPGTGDFGALVVKGVNLSPISASLYTEAAESKTLFTVAIASGEMIKLEMEVIAHGDENTVGSNLADAASFKYSVSAIRTAFGIEIKATEIAKEAFAQGVNLDIDITENGSSFTIAAKGASGMPKANWSAQIVKRMQMSGLGVVLELRS